MFEDSKTFQKISKRATFYAVWGRAVMRYIRNHINPATILFGAMIWHGFAIVSFPDSYSPQAIEQMTGGFITAEMYGLVVAVIGAGCLGAKKTYEIKLIGSGMWLIHSLWTLRFTVELGQPLGLPNPAYFALVAIMGWYIWVYDEGGDDHA